MADFKAENGADLMVVFGALTKLRNRNVALTNEEQEAIETKTSKEDVGNIFATTNDGKKEAISVSDVDNYDLSDEELAIIAQMNTNGDSEITYDEAIAYYENNYETPNTDITRYATDDLQVKNNSAVLNRSEYPEGWTTQNAAHLYQDENGIEYSKINPRFFGAFVNEMGLSLDGENIVDKNGNIVGRIHKNSDGTSSIFLLTDRVKETKDKLDGRTTKTTSSSSTPSAKAKYEQKEPKELSSFEQLEDGKYKFEDQTYELVDTKPSVKESLASAIGHEGEIENLTVDNKNYFYNGERVGLLVKDENGKEVLLVLRNDEAQEKQEPVSEKPAEEQAPELAEEVTQEPAKEVTQEPIEEQVQEPIKEQQPIADDTDLAGIDEDIDETDSEKIDEIEYLEEDSQLDEEADELIRHAELAFGIGKTADVSALGADIPLDSNKNEGLALALINNEDGAIEAVIEQLNEGNFEILDDLVQDGVLLVEPEVLVDIALKYNGDNKNLIEGLISENSLNVTPETIQIISNVLLNYCYANYGLENANNIARMFAKTLIYTDSLDFDYLEAADDNNIPIGGTPWNNTYATNLVFGGEINGKPALETFIKMTYDDLKDIYVDNGEYEITEDDLSNSFNMYKDLDGNTKIDEWEVMYAWVSDYIIPISENSLSNNKIEEKASLICDKDDKYNIEELNSLLDDDSISPVDLVKILLQSDISFKNMEILDSEIKDKLYGKIADSLIQGIDGSKELVIELINNLNVMGENGGFEIFNYLIEEGKFGFNLLIEPQALVEIVNGFGSLYFPFADEDFLSLLLTRGVEKEKASIVSATLLEHCNKNHNDGKARKIERMFYKYLMELDYQDEDELALISSFEDGKWLIVDFMENTMNETDEYGNRLYNYDHFLRTKNIEAEKESFIETKKFDLNLADDAEVEISDAEYIFYKYFYENCTLG